MALRFVPATLATLAIASFVTPGCNRVEIAPAAPPAAEETGEPVLPDGAYPAEKFKVAKAYESGAGLPRDPTKAAHWYRLAAEEGYAPAQAQLGLAYATGNGVERNRDEAVRWLVAAAAQGHRLARNVLVSLRRDG